MRKLLLGVATLLATLSASAIDDNTVVVTYDGNSASIEIASNISNYVSCTSGTSSHVKLVQSDNVNDKVGEILYTLKGSSSNGEFFMEGSYKATVVLDGLTLTNPDSTAIHIKNGKRQWYNEHISRRIIECRLEGLFSQQRPYGVRGQRNAEH